MFPARRADAWVADQLADRPIAGLTCGNQERIREAFSTLTEGIELAHRNGDRNQSTKIPNALGWLHHELGDVDRAMTHDQARDAARSPFSTDNSRRES